MGLSNDLSREAGSLSCCCPNPHGRFRPEVWGFISRSWSPGLRSLLRSLPFARFICVRMWGPRVLPTALPAPLSTTLSPALSVYLHNSRVAGSASARTACPVHPTLRQSQSRHGHVSPLHPGARLRHSYWSGWMFILYFLGVGPPCCSIFCQFWLCKEVQCVYLHRHLGSPLILIWFKLLSVKNQICYFKSKAKYKNSSWKGRSMYWKVIELFIWITKPFSFSTSVLNLPMFPIQTSNIAWNSYRFCFPKIYWAKYLTKIVPLSAEMQVCMAGLGTQQWSLMPNASPLYLHCCRHNRCRSNLFWKSFLFSVNLLSASTTVSNYETKPIEKVTTFKYTEL